MPQEVWVVGQTIEGRIWEIQGVFSSQEKAAEACRDHNYFIGPAIIDELWPHESVDWPGAYYPIAPPVDPENVEGVG